MATDEAKKDKSERDNAPRKQQLAEERTEWAEDRTVLANERTFAGWLRTGMGSIGVALGLQAVFKSAEPTWLAKSSATVFIFIAIAIFEVARRSAHAALRRLDQHSTEPVSATSMDLVSALLILGAVATGFVLWSA